MAAPAVPVPLLRSVQRIRDGISAARKARTWRQLEEILTRMDEQAAVVEKGLREKMVDS